MKQDIDHASIDKFLYSSVQNEKFYKLIWNKFNIETKKRLIERLCNRNHREVCHLNIQSYERLFKNINNKLFKYFLSKINLEDLIDSFGKKNIIELFNNVDYFKNITINDESIFLCCELLNWNEILNGWKFNKFSIDAKIHLFQNYIFDTEDLKIRCFHQIIIDIERHYVEFDVYKKFILDVINNLTTEFNIPLRVYHDNYIHKIFNYEELLKIINFDNDINLDKMKYIFNIDDKYKLLESLINNFKEEKYSPPIC